MTDIYVPARRIGNSSLDRAAAGGGRDGDQQGVDVDRNQRAGSGVPDRARRGGQAAACGGHDRGQPVT